MTHGEFVSATSFQADDSVVQVTVTVNVNLKSYQKNVYAQFVTLTIEAEEAVKRFT